MPPWSGPLPRHVSTPPRVPVPPSTAAGATQANGWELLHGVTVRIDSETRRLIVGQQGVVSREQLLAGGATPSSLQWHLGRRMQVLLPGVYQINRDPPSRQQREIAALLSAGPRSILSGLTAARRWGLESAEPGDRVHVQVPAPQRSRALAWLSITRTSRPDLGSRVHGAVRLANPARATLDAACQSGSPEMAAAIGIESVQRRLVGVDALVAELALRNQRGSALARHAVQAAATGAWSRPEATLLMGLARSPLLPAAWPNPLLTHLGRPLTSPDAWLDDVGLAVMVHSRRYHAGHLDWERTVEQDADLV